MRVGIDIRCLAEGRRTGVEEYTLNLLKNLFEIDSKNKYVLFLNALQKSRADLTWITKFPNVTLKISRYPNKILNFLFWYLRAPKIDKMLGGVDVLFFPNISFGSVSRGVKTIVTIHDLSFERYPEAFSRKRRLWHAFINPRKICQKATQILTVSESTKNDLVSMYGIEKEKIAVIYNGIAAGFQVISRNDPGLIAVKEKYKLPYKFILYFGTIEPRKNIRGIIQAFNQLQEVARQKNDEALLKFHLVIAGQEGWLGTKIDREIEKSQFRDKIVVAKKIPNEEKKYIYNLASLFVYPSLFEGFGFPPLEAMSCGVPVVTSNNSSLPEIVGKGAIMVEPDKPGEIFVALKSILTEPDLGQKLSVAGFATAAKFQWRRSAEEFLRIIEA